MWFLFSFLATVVSLTLHYMYVLEMLKSKVL